MITKFQIEHWGRSFIFKVFHHKTTFPYTQRHFRQSTEISRDFHTVCWSLVQKTTSSNMFGFAADGWCF